MKSLPPWGWEEWGHAFCKPHDVGFISASSNDYDAATALKALTDATLIGGGVSGITLTRDN
jgi:hypothetical protein